MNTLMRQLSLAPGTREATIPTDDFTRYLGVDLAWREGRPGLSANEARVAVIDPDGQILDAGWRHGVDETIAWADSAADSGHALMFCRIRNSRYKR